LAKKLNTILQVGGKRGFEFHNLVSSRVLEFERIGVKRRAIDDRVFGGCLGIF